MAAVQCLGGEVGLYRMPVARERQSRDGLARGFERRAQAVGQRALAGAVDALDRDEHAASVARLMANPVVCVDAAAVLRRDQYR